MVGLLQNHDNGCDNRDQDQRFNTPEDTLLVPHQVPKQKVDSYGGVGFSKRIESRGPFRSEDNRGDQSHSDQGNKCFIDGMQSVRLILSAHLPKLTPEHACPTEENEKVSEDARSEEHTSELESQSNL